MVEGVTASATAIKRRRGRMVMEYSCRLFEFILLNRLSRDDIKRKASRRVTVDSSIQ